MEREITTGEQSWQNMESRIAWQDMGKLESVLIENILKVLETLIILHQRTTALACNEARRPLTEYEAPRQRCITPTAPDARQVTDRLHYRTKLAPP